jgi:aspartate aminotransferase
MTVAKKMAHFMENASWIRSIFEEGARLKKIHGAENVFDFSLGNPNVPPPSQVKEKLLALVNRDEPGMHGYMPNAGLESTRLALAGFLSGEYGCTLPAGNIVMTCGAAGALNIILKAILDPGDEVLTPIPYFVEYGFYADNHGGVLKTAPTHEDFTLDLDALERAIGERTKVVLINSPNNPTGQIYSLEALGGLGEILRGKSSQYGRPVYLVSDEPYRRIVYDGSEVPCIFECYAESFIASSYSKDLSLPGERIGFAAVHPDLSEGARMIGALILANRIMGFVNAPALIQRLVAELQGVCVDVDIYRRKRDRLADSLKAMGYELTKPRGAFYLFPKSPLADELQFVEILQNENILGVPGRGFGCPGYFRLAYCVDDQTIEGSLPGFERALKKAKRMTQGR